MERMADAPGEAAAQLLGERARARAQPLRRLPRKRHVDVRGAGRLEPAGMGALGIGALDIRHLARPMGRSVQPRLIGVSACLGAARPYSASAGP